MVSDSVMLTSVVVAGSRVVWLVDDKTVVVGTIDDSIVLVMIWVVSGGPMISIV